MSKDKKSGTKVSVKNISDRSINVSCGTIEAGKFGDATLAELQCYSKVIERVEAKAKPVTKTRAKSSSDSLI